MKVSDMKPDELPTNAVIEGDCIEGMRKLPANSVDLIIADPPYKTTQYLTREKWGKEVSDLAGIKGIATFNAEWDKMTEAEYSDFTFKWVSEAYRVLRDKGTMYVNCILTVEFLCLTDVALACKKAGFTLLNNIAWCKPNGQPNLAGVRYAFSKEDILWVGKGGEGRRTFNYRDLKGMNGGKQMRDFWILPTEGKEFDHPSPKPVSLYKIMVRASSNKDDLVLDPFMGSGTTAVACAELQRKFIGFESNPDYIKIIGKRLETWKGQSRLE